MSGARSRRRRQVPFIAQLTPTDCGAASLCAALAYHGKEVAPNMVRGLLGGGRNGVTAKQIVVAARELGLNARGVRITPDKLAFLPSGSILHWDLSHFVVFESFRKGVVTLVDPAVGRRTLGLDEVSASLSGVAVALEPGQDFKPEKRPRSDRWARYKSWLFGAKHLWGRILVTSFFLQLLALSLPGLTSVLIDRVVPRNDSQLLTLIACGFLTVGSFFFLSNFLRARLLLQLRTRVESGMSFHFIEHLLSLPYAFFQQRSAGDVMMRLSSQAHIRELLTTGALSAILDGVMVTIYLVLLAGAAPLLAIIAVGISLVQAATYSIAGRTNRRLVVEGLASQARLEGYQVEMLGGIESLKSMGATDRAVQRWGDLYVDSLNRSIERGELDGTFSALVGALRFAGPLTLMLAGAFQVLSGELTLGTMMGLSALGAGFLEPITKLVNTGMQLTQLKGYMERIEDVLDAEPERTNGAGRGSAPLELRGGLRVQNLSFRYPSEPKPALDGVSFSVEPGQSVAIVGASGSGKSTLARTLAGLYEPMEGEVFYDEREMRTLNLRALRNRLGVVTQDVRLFSGSIRDNVTMFDPDITQAAVELACQMAALHEDIGRMPMGYDTMLADGGSSVSGGQRQRLALARALVRGPSILILDEATSALDTVTEARVQQCLRRLRCTRVIVAHRLSTVQEADKIVVMQNGKVAATGTHAELLQNSEAYQGFIYAQVDASSDVPILRPRPSSAPPRTAEPVVSHSVPAPSVQASIPPAGNSEPPAQPPREVSREPIAPTPTRRTPAASAMLRELKARTRAQHASAATAQDEDRDSAPPGR